MDRYKDRRTDRDEHTNGEMSILHETGTKEDLALGWRASALWNQSGIAYRGSILPVLVCTAARLTKRRINLHKLC